MKVRATQQVPRTYEFEFIDPTLRDELWNGNPREQRIHCAFRALLRARRYNHDSLITNAYSEEYDQVNTAHTILTETWQWATAVVDALDKDPA